nr:hypothetical protein GCM10020092_066070 [Actinoplanes digitatis]
MLRRRRGGYASFEADWIPAEYLSGYYRTVDPDEIATIAFLVAALRRAERDRPVLFFGVGPTLHHVFAAAEVASEIHLGDYLPANLAEIRRWLDRAPGAHDWRPFVRYTLRCEGNPDPTDEDVAAREELTRTKVTALLRVDGRDPRPVDREYATVVSAYCADSATADRGTWAAFMRHITGLVRPGGLFVTAALRRCRGYTVGGRSFPAPTSTSTTCGRCWEPASMCRADRSRSFRWCGGRRTDTRGSCSARPADDALKVAVTT